MSYAIRSGGAGPRHDDAGHLPEAAQLDEGDLGAHSGLEAQRSAGGNVEPESFGQGPIERKRRIRVGEMQMRADLNGTITVIHYGHMQLSTSVIDFQFTGSGPDLTGDHGIGEVIVTSLRPSGKVASTWTSCSISG